MALRCGPFVAAALLSSFAFVPEADADCIAPGYCVCGDGPTTILEGSRETEGASVFVVVEAIYGNAADFMVGERVEVTNPYPIGDSRAETERVLVYITENLGEMGVLGIRTDGTVDCDAGDPVAPATAVDLALTDDCYDQAASLGFEQGCSDTEASRGCSTGAPGGCVGLWTLAGLGLLGVGRRRRSQVGDLRGCTAHCSSRA